MPSPGSLFSTSNASYNKIKNFQNVSGLAQKITEVATAKSSGTNPLTVPGEPAAWSLQAQPANDIENFASNPNMLNATRGFAASVYDDKDFKKDVTGDGKLAKTQGTEADLEEAWLEPGYNFNSTTHTEMTDLLNSDRLGLSSSQISDILSGQGPESAMSKLTDDLDKQSPDDLVSDWAGEAAEAAVELV